MSTQPLLTRMWALRDDVSGYDAACVAVAEASGCPLVTADEHLARLDNLRCDVRLASQVAL
jgi:predicted nucleic acid-binding protein